jgi:hypothetical protein
LVGRPAAQRNRQSSHLRPVKPEAGEHGKLLGSRHQSEPEEARFGRPVSGVHASTYDSKQFELLQITDEHLAAVVDLPFHHKDPFDRLLVAQSMAENVSIVSSDALLDAYAVKRIW